MSAEREPAGGSGRIAYPMKTCSLSRARSAARASEETYWKDCQHDSSERLQALRACENRLAPTRNQTAQVLCPAQKQRRNPRQVDGTFSSRTGFFFDRAGVRRTKHDAASNLGHSMSASSLSAFSFSSSGSTAWSNPTKTLSTPGTFSNNANARTYPGAVELRDYSPTPETNPHDPNLGLAFPSAVPSRRFLALSKSSDPNPRDTRNIMFAPGSRSRPPLYHPNGRKIIRAYDDLGTLTGSREAALQARAAWAFSKMRHEEKSDPFVSRFAVRVRT